MVRGKYLNFDYSEKLKLKGGQDGGDKESDDIKLVYMRIFHLALA